ncbi:MAG: hypothetical protein ABS916_07775 [Carnobacterium sp.]|uniref:hypothetical protein n=1 Tax=Carnobacterium sp. TaxID=48221 RepID=UPI003315DF6D
MVNESKKSNGLILAFFFTYIIANVILFFEIISANPSLSTLLKESQLLLKIDSLRFSIFMVTIVVLLNTMIIIVTFLILKLCTQIILKKEFHHEKDLLVTLLLSSSLSAVTSLLLSEFFTIDYFILSFVTSTLEYVLFVFLYKTNVKNTREIITVSGVKLVLLIVNIIFIFKV